jgi:hypothetical protein
VSPTRGWLSPRLAGLQLLGLTGLAFGPFLGLLRNQPEFLVAHRATGGALVALVATLLLLLPALLLGLEGLAGLASQRLRLGLHLVLVALFAGAALLPLLARVPALPGALALGLAALLTLLFAGAQPRSARLRLFTAALALAPLFYATSFFASPAIARLVSPETGARAPAVPAVATTPVVLVVFDELPLASLLGADEQIDATSFPGFAELARESTWFPFAAAVSGVTRLAIPALLSGRYPDPALLPVLADHPENLLSWLAPSYALHASEPRTLLSPGHSASPEPRDSAARLRLLASDLAILLGHFALPRDLAVRLPPVSDDWVGYGSTLRAMQRSRAQDRRGDFLRYVEEIRPCAGPCLYFLHGILPHVPWEYTETGHAYTGERWTPGLRASDTRWGPEDRWAAEGQQRHLFQVALADALLARLLARLRESDLYERSLVVVTADHGASFWPGARRRAVEAGHPHLEDLLRVPLFIKAPQQREARVDARLVESVDLLPSIAGLLGEELPFPTDGRSAFDPAFPARDASTAVTTRGKRLAVPRRVFESRASLDLKLARFGAGSGSGLFGYGPRHALVGASAADLPRDAAPPLAIELASETFEPAGRVPTRLAGILREAGDADQPPQLAAAVAGRIRAVAPALPFAPDAFAFSLFLPDTVREAPASALELFLVRGAPDAPVLRATRLTRRPLFDELLALRSWEPTEPPRAGAPAD